MSDNNGSFARLWTQGKEYAKLKFEYAKLTFTEKLAILLSAVAVCAVALLIGIIALLFLSVSVVLWMASAIGMAWSCAIMGCVYVTLMLLAIVLRKQLFVNPITRLVSRLILSNN